MNKVVKYILTRMGMVYIILAVACAFVFDFKVFFQTTAANVLDHHTTWDYEYFVQVLEGEKDVDMGKMAQYQDYFDRCLKYQLGIPVMYLFKGITLYHMDDVQGAIANFKKFNEFDTNYLWGAYNLGLIYYEQEQYELAEQAFAQAQAVNNPLLAETFIVDNFKFYGKIIRHFMDEKEVNITEMGRNFMIHSMRANKKAYTLIRIGQLLRAHGPNTWAIALKMPMNDENMNWPFFYLQLGRKALQQEQFAQAKVFFEKSINLKKMNPYAYEGLSAVAKAFGSTAMAIAMLREQQILRTFPKQFYGDLDVNLRIW